MPLIHQCRRYDLQTPNHRACPLDALGCGIEWVWGGNAHVSCGYKASVSVYLIKEWLYTRNPCTDHCADGQSLLVAAKGRGVARSALSDFVQMSRLLGPQVYGMTVQTPEAADALPRARLVEQQ